MLAAVVRARQSAVEVGQEIHIGAVVLAFGQDAGDCDADVGFGVVADDGGVDEEGQERVLVLGGVFFEESGRVVVADGGVGGALGEGCGGEGGQGGQDGGGTHIGCFVWVNTNGVSRIFFEMKQKQNQ